MTDGAIWKYFCSIYLLVKRRDKNIPNSSPHFPQIYADYPHVVKNKQVSSIDSDVTPIETGNIKSHDNNILIYNEFSNYE